MAILIYSVVDKDSRAVVYESTSFQEVIEEIETLADHDELAVGRVFVIEASVVV